jgi:two-component system OmpR family response regulator
MVLWSDMAEKILIVEDDSNLQAIIAYNLRKESYEVNACDDGKEALEVARREKPDLIILDIMLPGLSGLDICRILRKESTVPILMLTARTEETDKIVGLELGADDYMSKPFSMKEFLARVRAMLRRAGMMEVKPSHIPKIVTIGDIKIDVSRHQVVVRGVQIELTPKEFDLLAFLAENKGLVFTRERLLEKVWEYDYAGDTRTVDVHVRWLRQKIETDPANPIYLVTVRGTGYKLEG